MPTSQSLGLRSTIFASAVAVALVGLIPTGCSAGSALSEGIGGGGNMCKAADCGKACTIDTNCSSGLYCRSGQCGQDCNPGTSCGTGRMCDANGRCPASGTGGTGSSAGGTSGTSGTGNGGSLIVDAGNTDPDAQDTCLQKDVEFTTGIPNVLLLVDRSGSMSNPITMGGTDVRWTAVRNALIDPTTGLVPVNQGVVNFGLALYTGPDSKMNPIVGDMATVGTADPDYVENASCPYLVQVPLALNNFTAIDAAYRPITMSSMAKGQTPTGESIAAVVPTLTGLDPVAFPGRKVIVLATDGEPDLCSNGNDENGGRMRSLTAVSDAYDAGITTFVISVGSDVGEQHLRQVANAGQGFPTTDTTDRFYRAGDAAELAQAFQDIVNGVRACVIALDGTVKGDGADGTVTINGMPVTFGDPNGWRLNNPSEVEFLGSACELIKSSQGAGSTLSISLKFPCGSFDPH